MKFKLPKIKLPKRPATGRRFYFFKHLGGGEIVFIGRVNRYRRRARTYSRNAK